MYLSSYLFILFINLFIYSYLFMWGLFLLIMWGFFLGGFNLFRVLGEVFIVLDRYIVCIGLHNY